MAEGLVNEICSIKGEHLSDIFKTFALLVKNQNELFQTNIDAIFVAFKPQNFFHQHLKLKLIDIFKQTAEVDNILKSCDLSSICRVLKFDWYFQKINDCNVLVNEAMPSMSFCTRVKVVKQYSKNLTNQKTAESLFTALNQRYDLNLAFITLPGCSEKFIRMKIPTFRTQLPPEIFNKLFNLHPDLMKEYLEFVLEGVHKRKRAFRNYQIDRYENVFSKIISRDPKLFMNFFDKYNAVIPYMQLGRRNSKRLMRSDLQTFIKNYQKYSRITKLKYIVKYLNLTELENLQFTLFPKTLTAFFKAGRYDDFLEVTRDLPKHLREEIIMRNFNKVFGRPLSVEEFSEALSVDTIKLLPDRVRCNWIETKLATLESVYDKANYIKYLPTESSIPKLKELMEVQSEVNARATLLQSMVTSIKFNGDIDCLVEVINYFLKRYRNDNVLLREKLFSELYDLDKLLRLMKAEDWNCMHELLKLVKLYKEQITHRYYLKYIFMHRTVSFFKRGQPMEEHLKYYFDTEKYLFEYYDYDLCKDSIYQKPCLLYFLSVVPNLTFQDREKERESVKLLFERISSFNSKNKKSKIEIPEWMKNIVLEYMISPPENYFGKKEVLDHLKKDPILKEEIFPKIFPAYLSPVTVANTLKYNPTTILDNLDQVMGKIFVNIFDKEYYSFFKPARLYSSFGIPEKLVEICINKLNGETETDEEKYSAKTNAVKILSLLVQSDVYLKMIEKYYPTDSTIDYSEDNDSLYRIQEEIALSLKNFNNPCDALVPLRKFAVGDYLKYVVGSINSITQRVSEDKIIPVLNEWMDSPISVRKHFIRSFYLIAPKSAKSQLIKDFFPNEKNPSMRLLLFQQAFRFFSNEPCEESFEVFKFTQDNLSEKDEEVIDKMYELDKVPDEFVSRYIEAFWKLINLREDKLGPNARNKLVCLIDKEVLQLLNEEFNDNVLNQIFSKDNLENIHLLSFVCHYLLYSSEKDIQLSRLDKVMAFLKPMIIGHWNEFNLLKYTVFPVRNMISFLIKDLCNDSRDREKLILDPCPLLKEFKTQIKTVLQEDSILEQLILLDFTIAYHEHFVDTTGSKLTPEIFVNFTKSILIKYSGVNNAVLLNIVKDVIPFTDLEGGSREDQEKGYIALCELLLSDPTELCNILGVMLTSNRINEDYFVSHYKNIFKLIFENPHSSVKICANSLLCSLVSTVKVT